MSVYKQKNPNGTVKSWVVGVRRQNCIHKKYFKSSEYQKAVDYEKQLLKSLPKKLPSGKPKGYKNMLKTNGLTTKSFTRNNCILQWGEIGERCSIYESCIFYDDCLYEAAKRNWPGFTNTFTRGIQ